MALTFAYTSESIDGDEFRCTLTDETTYGSGGVPARNTGSVYVTVEKIKQDTTSDYDVTLESYTATTATTFSFNIEEDGWFQAYCIFIPTYNALTAYVQYDAVVYNDVVYRALQSSTGQTPAAGAYWEVISEPTSLIDNDGTASESANIHFEIFNVIIYPFAKTLFGTRAYEAALECCADCERSEDVQRYEQIGVIVDAINTCNLRDRFATGEKLARKAAELA